VAEQWITIERRFSDLDLLGHVNNVVYHEYLQEARFRLLAALGRETVEAAPMVVARQEIDHISPLHASTEPVLAQTWVESIGRSSFVVACTLYDAPDVVAARARSVLVFIDATTGNSVPMSESMRMWLTSALADGVHDGGAS
jgi:acyl-CoA thioester hydrolase